MKKPNLNLKRASVLTSTLLCSALLIAAPLRRELNEGWKFKQARLNNWYPATVPGVVHTDLMDNKIIEDPFFRLNERSMQWIDKEDWVYQTTFHLTPEMMERQNIWMPHMPKTSTACGSPIFRMRFCMPMSGRRWEKLRYSGGA